MKAVIYARYSSDNQREESIEGQIRECREYAERNGMTVVNTYVDRALSAKTDHRPEFQRMVKDSAKGVFDIVIVWELDRFARNRYDSAHYKTVLKKNGVKVVSARESIAEGSEGILLEAMLEGYAEYFSADLAEKVLRGMTENALKCMNNGAGTPFGYYVDDTQHLQIDEHNAQFVREIFQRFADGEMIKTIVEDLNKRGARLSYKLKKSKSDVKNHERLLSYNSIRHILSNRKYIGEYKFRDIVIPGGVPSIVDEDLFNKVQQRLEMNKKAPAKHKAEDDYLLTTKLFCGKCKAMMVGESGTSGTSKVYRYYKCVNQKKKHSCDKKPVAKEYIEDLVVKAVFDKIMDDNLMEQLADSIYELQSRENIKVTQLKSRITEIDNGIKNMLDAIQRGIILESTKQRLSDLEEEKKTVELELIKEEIASPVLTKEQILYSLTRFRSLDLSTREGRQTLIDCFVNSIYLYDDSIILTCNYKDGTAKLSFSDIESSDLFNDGVPL